MDIVATGMVCSVGLTAASACAAIRARIARFHELPYIQTGGEPIVGSLVPDLRSDFEDPRRLVEMLSSAIEDCLCELVDVAHDRVPLLLGLSEPGRPGGAIDPAAVIQGVEKRLGIRFHPKQSRTISKGHIAGLEALDAARELCQQPGIPACLVGAVDSFLNARSLHWLEQHRRLKTSENSDGVIPGEAAAVVLVRSRPSETAQVAVKVCGLGFAHEAAGVLSDEPLLGIGLARAARAALDDAGLRMHEIDYRLSDVTGEQYGFREQALAMARLLKVRRECLPIWHCSDAIGDTGSAAGLCQFVIATDAYRKRYAPGKRAICFTSAVPGDRAVAVIERQVLDSPDQGGSSAASPPGRAAFGSP